MLYTDYVEDKANTFYVTYTRDATGNITQADVEFNIGGELLDGKFIPKA